jgi:hypothetical protein
MTGQLAKWLRYYSPLFRGRFDFFLSADAPRREAWHQGLDLTGGRFWIRLLGGHDLRRKEGSAGQGEPSSSDVLAGRSDGRSATVTTFPWVPHRAGVEYLYGLTAVGGGGVAGTDCPPVVRAVFDDDGELRPPAPNVVQDLVVEPLNGGRFHLRWMYDERDQEVQPQEFEVYSDAASPGEVNYAAVVAAVPYQFRRGGFSWISEPFVDGSRVTWGVRSVAAGGTKGPVGREASGYALARGPQAPSGITAKVLET